MPRTHTSNYRGKVKIVASLRPSTAAPGPPCHILGECSRMLYEVNYLSFAWRARPEGEDAESVLDMDMQMEGWIWVSVSTGWLDGWMVSGGKVARWPATPSSGILHLNFKRRSSVLCLFCSRFILLLISFFLYFYCRFALCAPLPFCRPCCHWSVRQWTRLIRGIDICLPSSPFTANTARSRVKCQVCNWRQFSNWFKCKWIILDIKF